MYGLLWANRKYSHRRMSTTPNTLSVCLSLQRAAGQSRASLLCYQEEGVNKCTLRWPPVNTERGNEPSSQTPETSPSPAELSVLFRASFSPARGEKVTDRGLCARSGGLLLLQIPPLTQHQCVDPEEMREGRRSVREKVFWNKTHDYK